MADLTNLQNIDEINRWDNRPFTGVWPESRGNKSTDINRTIKKKPKRIRTAYTTEQLQTLEKLFTLNRYIASDHRQQIATLLNVNEKSIKVWFQNRRMKLKKSSESSNDSSNDTSVSEMSPPPFPRAELQNSVQVTTQEAQSTDDQDEQISQTVPSECYQFPSFYSNYVNNEVFQTAQVSGNIPANSMQFYSDHNGFPTQYYPYHDNSNFNDHNNYQYQQKYAMDNNYCSNANDVDFSCFFD